jgi:hypothetical protein
MSKQVVYFIALILVYFFTSCEQSTDNSEKSKSSIEQANEALATVLYNLVNSSNVEDPADVDFSRPFALYQEAYNYDKSNPDANFGLGLCGIFMITQDQEIQDAIDEWSTYLESNVPFEAPLAKRTRTSFPTSINDFKIPVNDLAKSITGTYKMILLDAPKFSGIQDLLEAKLLSKLNFALQALDKVDDHSGYTFILTPKMQGDLAADPLEIDLTEIYALEAGLNMFSFMINMGLSYSVDFNSYDSLGIIQTFSPGSTFMTVRQSGQYLVSAKSKLLAMGAKIIAGVTFLRNETDDQNNDIIKIDAGDEAALDDIIDGVNDFLDMMANGTEVTADWDDNSFTPEEPLTINFNEYFDDPIQDFKELLPAYTVSVARDTIGYKYNWNDEYTPITATVYFPQSNYYFYSRSFNWQKDGFTYQYADSNIDIPEFRQAFNQKLSQLQATAGIDYIYMYLYWGNNYAAPGTYQIETSLYSSIDLRAPALALFVPVISWNANSFEEWVLPDPTFSDILPGMTDWEFKRIFGITAEDWSKSTSN